MTKQSQLLKIGQAAKALNVSIQTLRRWEESGKLSPIKTNGGTRYYSKEELRTLNPEGVAKLEENIKIDKSLDTLNLIKIGDTAEILNVSIQTLRRWEKSKRLLPQKSSGGTRFYNLDKVNDFKEKLAKKSPKPSTSDLSSQIAPYLPPINPTQYTKYPREISPLNLPESFSTHKKEETKILTDTSEEESLKKPHKIPIPRSSYSLLTTGLLIGAFLAIMGGNQLINHFISKGNKLAQGSSLQTLSSPQLSSVLAASEPSSTFLELNTDTTLNGRLKVSGDASVSGTLVAGAVSAPNIVNSITAGDNVTITGGVNNPTIGVSIPPQVTINGIVGGATLKAGTDISISSSSASLTLADTSTLDSVTSRGASTGNSITIGGLTANGSASITGATTLSSAGSASTPALDLTGTIYSGGTSTTTKPLALIEPSGTTSNGWNTSGTLLGVNSPSSFSGNLLDLQKNGVSQFSIDSSGNVNISGNITTSSGSTVGFWTRNSGVLSPSNAGDSISVSGTINGLSVSSGTITSGTWNGTAVATAYGGLGANVTPAGAGELLYSTSTSGYGHLAAGTSGYVLTSGGTGSPVWVSSTSLTAGGVPFSGITSGTNTQAAMLVGTGASLDFTGTGTINASSLLGSTWASPSSIGSTTANSGTFTTLHATGATTLDGTINSNTFTNTGLTFAGSSPVISASTTGSSISLNPGTDGTVYLNGGGAHGCSLDTTTGNFSCGGSITSSGGGATGYWSTDGLTPPTLTPTTSTAKVTLNNALDVSGTSGTITAGALVTAQNGLTLSTGALNLTSTSGAANLTLGSSTTAFDVNSGVFDIDTANSRVGVGTTSPGTKLDISTTSSLDGITLNGTTNPGITLKTSGTVRGYIGLPTATNVYATGAVLGDIVYRTQGGKILFDTNGGSGTPAFTIGGSNGNVGIGTTNPGTKLEVDGNQKIVTTSGISLNLANNGVNSSHLALYGGTDGGNTSSIYAYDSTGTMRMATGDAGNFALYNSSGTSKVWLGSSSDSYITGGNVGVGTSSPGRVGTTQFSTSHTFLNVAGSSSNMGILDLQDGVSSPNNTVGALVFSSSGLTSAYGDLSAIYGGIENTATAGEYGGNLQFATRPDATTTWSERMRITSTGKVGIGTTNPNATLDVEAASEVGGILSNGGCNAVGIGCYNGFKATYSGGSSALGEFETIALNGSTWSTIYLASGSSSSDLINTDSGAVLTVGGTWTNASDVNIKTGFTPINDNQILSKISTMPVTQWSYKREGTGILHIGPVAQDFYSLFGLGDSNKAITTVDEAGIALAGIQGLASQTTLNVSSSDSLEVGDVVTLSDSSSVAKTQGSYQNSVAGVVTSTDASFTSVVPGSTSTLPYLISLSGNAQVKVSTENGNINVGDYLTSSSTPGVAMKATHAGEIVGQALENYSGTGIGKILVFVKVGYTDPSNILANMSLDDSGNIIMPKVKTDHLELSGVNTTTLKSVEDSLDPTTLSQVGDAVNSGTDSTHVDLATTINTIVASQIQTEQKLADLFSRVAGVATTSAMLSASQSALSQQVSSASAQIASTSAQLANLQSQSASTSAALATLLNQPLTSPSTLTATGSASLTDLNVSDTLSTLKLSSIDATISGTLNVLTQANLPSTTVAGDFNVDGTVSLTGNSINSIGLSTDQTQTGVLYIQNNPLASLVDFFNGLVTIDKDGTLLAQKLEVSSQTLSEGTISANQTSVTISNNLVTSNSNIFVTAISSTGGQALFVSNQTAGQGFSVSLDHAIGTDVKFKWWIVDNK